MKQICKLYHLLVAVALASALAACSSEDLPDVKPNGQNCKHTVKMELIGEVVGFDHQNALNNKVQTRTSTTSFKTGDKIYLEFDTGSSIVTGIAKYSSTTSGWNVSYDGDLPTGTNLKCMARYFVNATSETSSLVTL